MAELWQALSKLRVLSLRICQPGRGWLLPLLRTCSTALQHQCRCDGPDVSLGGQQCMCGSGMGLVLAAGAVQAAVLGTRRAAALTGEEILSPFAGACSFSCLMAPGGLLVPPVSQG